MERYGIGDEYFEWMCHLVYDDRYSKKISYRKLLSKLHEINFEWIYPMDANRASDGIDLRYRFGYENDYDGVAIASTLDIYPCSVLEMMIALALRCEEHIMEDPDIGDRTGQWFWNMIISLGLGGMSDGKFREDYVENAIDRFMKRDYERTGEGGLFTVDDGVHDMRTTDIWYQMHYYLGTLV